MSESITSQGSTLSFNGFSGSLLTVSYSGGSANATDIGGLTTRSDGGDPFVVSRLDVTSVSPGSVSVTFFGSGGGLRVGAIGSLSIRVGGGGSGRGFSGEAFVSDYQVEASVGEFVRGSATFTMTGR